MKESVSDTRLKMLMRTKHTNMKHNPLRPTYPEGGMSDTRLKILMRTQHTNIECDRSAPLTVKESVSDTRLKMLMGTQHTRKVDPMKTSNFLVRRSR